MKLGKTKSFFKSTSSKKQHTLILFLLFSSFFWLLTKMSKEYETRVVYNVNYINLPSSKLFQNTPNPKIALYVKGIGFDLFKEKTRISSIDVNLQNVISKGKYTYFLLPNAKKQEVQKQLGNNIELLGFEKDSLFFELGFNKHKKIPVVANLDLRFKSGYNLSNNVHLIPDSIEVSGPEIQVDQINSISSELLVVDEIIEDLNNEVSLVIPDDLDKLNYSSTEVNVVAKVDKFTEGSFKIPFIIEGLPEGTRVTTYPNAVEVVFQVGLTDYKKINASDFDVVCDYIKHEEENTYYLIPKLVKKPTLVSAIKLVPNRIEYLIQK